MVVQGRTVFEYFRDGNPDTLRDTQSVAKSALAALVGTALQQGHISSLDQPVVELVPAWRGLNSDARALGITLRHLLTMTAGFEVNDPAGTAPLLAPARAWARPLAAAPGTAFAYDNSIVPLVMAVLEAASGKPLLAYAGDQLVQPLGMATPSFERGLHMRTIDMARLGHLFLAGGHWDGKALFPAGFASDTTRQHNRGGAPAGLPYGMFWWTPSASTYFASGYAGQFIWVHPPLGLVVATNTSVSAGSQQRGQALQLIRGRIFQAVQRRLAATAR